MCMQSSSAFHSCNVSQLSQPFHALFFLFCVLKLFLPITQFRAASCLPSVLFSPCFPVSNFLLCISCLQIPVGVRNLIWPFSCLHEPHRPSPILAHSLSLLLSSTCMIYKWLFCLHLLVSCILFSVRIAIYMFVLFWEVRISWTERGKWNGVEHSV